MNHVANGVTVNGTPKKLDHVASARLVIGVRDTGEPLAKAIIKRLADPEYGDGALLIVDDPENGLVEWLDTVEARDPAKAATFRRAFEEAEADEPEEQEPANTWPILAPGLCVRCTDRDNFGEVVEDQGDRAVVHFVSPGGHEATATLHKSNLLNKDGSPLGSEAVNATAPDEKPFDLGLIDSETFFGETYELRWHAEEIIVADQTGVIGGASKTLKTSILIDAAISFASGSPFLGRFRIPEQVPVALISGESGRAVIQANAKQVCNAKGIDYKAAKGVFWGFGLPSLTNKQHLTVIRQAIKDRELKVLMLDPLYMSLLAGNLEINAGNMYQMGPILDAVAQTCLEEGCTPYLAHHFVKKRDDPFGPATLEDLAFSGIGQFVRQWMLLSRRERYDPESGLHKFTFSYGGSAGHSGEMHLDIDTGQITSDLNSGRRWGVTCSTPSEGRANRLEQEKAAREAKEAEKIRLAELRTEGTLLANVGKVVEAIRTLAKGNRAASKDAIRNLANLSGDKASAALARAETDGRIERYTADVSNRMGKRAVEAYRLTTRLGRDES